MLSHTLQSFTVAPRPLIHPGRMPRLWLTMLLGACVSLVLIVGCATSPAYKSLAAVGQAVDVSVTVYFDLVVKGLVRTNDVPKVSRAYNQFQFVFSNAVVLVRMDSKAPPDTNVIAVAGRVLNIVAEAQRTQP